MGFEAFIANKHLTRRHRSGIVSMLSFITISGVALGVAALIVVMAVFRGFDRELQNSIVSVQPHIRVEQYGGVINSNKLIEQIKALHHPSIASISSFVEGEAILRSDHNTAGIVIKGLDVQHDDLSVFQKHLIYGGIDLSESQIIKEDKRFLWFEKNVTKKIGSILLGENLANVLRVRVGDTVSLVAPPQDWSKPLALLKSENRLFVVKGIFRIGMNDYDSNLGIVSLSHAQQIYYGADTVNGISIRLKDIREAGTLKYWLYDKLPNEYVVRTWEDLNRTFLQALKVERSAQRIMLSLISVVATFNIIATLTMVVMEKTRDIGLLRALGATKGSIRKIFLMEGFTLGIFGVNVGVIGGFLIVHYRNEISLFLKNSFGVEIFPSDIYLFDQIPAQINYHEVLITVAFAMLSSVVASLFPAHQAASLNPIEALRYE